MSNVKYIKLSTTEEILATVEDNNHGVSYKLTNMILVLPVRDQQGNPTITFLPFAMGVKDNTVTIKDSDIIFMEDVADDVLAHYNKIFSKIEIPSSDTVVQLSKKR